MLTPIFELSQDDIFLYAHMRAPYVKAGSEDQEVYFEGNDFVFYCKPYYLRLNLPGKVVNEEDPSVCYNVDNGTFTVKMKKTNPGEHFEGLDLLTKLLKPKGKPSASGPLIEVINTSNCEETEGCEDDEFDWFIEQVPASQENITFLGNSQCGFANLHPCSVFKLKEEIREIFDIVDPETKSAHVIHQERLAAEFEKFDPDHYLADLHEDEEIQNCLEFSPDWNDLYDKLSTSSVSHGEIIHFTSAEKDKLIKLPNKEYLIDKSEAQTLFLGLVDILFAYAYDKRTTLGDSTVESGWTINKLSSTLTWLEKFATIGAVAQSCVRRSLCYPLYRHWDLAMTVLSDTRKILSLGRKYVLKCLLEIHSLLIQCDPRYILNDLYITDYCVWIQSKSCKSKVLRELGEALNKVEITKEDMDFELPELERAAELAVEEENLVAGLRSLEM